MLSAVLRSKTAVSVSVRIMDSFVEMRHFIVSNAAMFEQIRAVELRQLEYQKTTDERLERVFDYMEAHEVPKQKVFFDGQTWAAFELLVSLVKRAEREIVLIDGYVDTGTLNILAKKRIGVAATIWTHPSTRLTEQDVDAFNAQYPRLEVERTIAFHDRFLILDGGRAIAELTATSISSYRHSRASGGRTAWWAWITRARRTSGSSPRFACPASCRWKISTGPSQKRRGRRGWTFPGWSSCLLTRGYASSACASVPTTTSTASAACCTSASRP
ncbi:hypothetical protein [Slackia exigua]